ncbi:hypothetical protein LBMAG52_15170 [Planctomycetia bacterium]|nr:hypothetical protein LBMAG52_15170 [Planctomycetia bacterium]
MSLSSPWLATLQRVREYRRDAAFLSLAQNIQAATKIQDTADSVEVMLSGLGMAQQQISHAGRLDPERLRQFRQERDHLQSNLADLRRQQVASEALVRQTQDLAAAKNAEAEVLRRLQDRLDSTIRQTQRRQEEQTPLEVAASLCNGRLSG